MLLEKEEPKIIINYIKENNITIQPLESGLYFKELVAGEGNYPTEGNTVTVHYTHYDLKSNLLQSSREDNMPFTYIVGTGAVIKGWEEAVQKMKVGGKAWLLVPSKLGWGNSQRVKDIKAYSPLVFEIELISIDK